MTTVSIDRTALSLPPLVIGSDGAPPYSLTDKGLGRPAITPRIQNAPDSPWLDGSFPWSVTKDVTSLPLEVLIQSDTAAGLETAISDLEDALWQDITFLVTVAEGGRPGRVWRCTPAAYGIADGVVLSHNVADFFEVWAITFGVSNPNPGAA